MVSSFFKLHDTHDMWHFYVKYFRVIKTSKKKKQLKNILRHNAMNSHDYESIQICQN